MLVVCPTILKHGAKTWEEKVATDVGDIVMGAVNNDGTIRAYVGIEKEPNKPDRRFPLVMISMKEAPKDTVDEFGFPVHVENPDKSITIEVFENPHDKASKKVVLKLDGSAL